MTFDLDDARVHLRRTPQTLRALLEPLPAAWLTANEGPETWSPVQVLRHLIWCEVDDWIPRAQRIAQHGTALAFSPFDREGGEPRYAGLSVPELLSEFARLRTANVKALDDLGLTSADLSRVGTHPELGPVTMGQLLATWVAHDLSHVVQISRTLAAQYREAVGPWRQYLRVLQ